MSIGVRKAPTVNMALSTATLMRCLRVSCCHTHLRNARRDAEGGGARVKKKIKAYCARGCAAAGFSTGWCGGGAHVIMRLAPESETPYMKPLTLNMS